MRGGFIAEHSFGVTKYISRTTGRHYSVTKDGLSYLVRCASPDIEIWTDKLCKAMSMIETLDQANA